MKFINISDTCLILPKNFKISKLKTKNGFCALFIANENLVVQWENYGTCGLKIKCKTVKY